MRKLFAGGIIIAALGIAITGYELDTYGIKAKVECDDDSIEKHCLVSNSGPLWRGFYKSCEFELDIDFYNDVLTAQEKKEVLKECADWCSVHVHEYYSHVECWREVRNVFLKNKQAEWDVEDIKKSLLKEKK